MRLGLHMPNYDQPTPADWLQIERVRPQVVTTMCGGTYHAKAIYDHLEQLCRPQYLVRVGYGVQDANGVLRDLERAQQYTAGVDPARVIYRIANEPNHEGWPAAQYRDVFLTVACCTSAPLMLANLCLNEGWQEYLSEIAPAAEAAEAIGLSLYRDDGSDPSRWLSEYERHNRPLYAVEWNVDYERGERRAQWLRWSAGILGPHLAGATVYLVGGTPDWELYSLTWPEIAGYAGVVAENALLPFARRAAR